jgi:MoxR-like ATPase
MRADEVAEALVEGAERVILGKQPFLQMLAACILARGHVLIEDNPGLGKTTVAKTFAALIGGADDAAPLVFKRIQFTPDLLPYDITGVDVFDNESRSFRFVPGPVLANIVLADEINRTTPKVQSALLEIMGERQVTIGSTTHKSAEPFFVIATENPVESEGTFPLPAAQLDRFMMRLSIGYPDLASEIAILDGKSSETTLRELRPVIGARDFLLAQESAANVFCHPALKEAIAGIVRETRARDSVALGASPRAALHLLAAARALAVVRKRAYVTDDDIASLAVPVLAHRLKLKNTRAEKDECEALVKEITGSQLERVRAV